MNIKMSNREKRAATACGACVLASIACFAVFAFQFSAWLVASMVFAYVAIVIAASED